MYLIIKIQSKFSFYTQKEFLVLEKHNFMEIFSYCRKISFHSKNIILLFWRFHFKYMNFSHHFLKWENFSGIEVEQAIFFSKDSIFYLNLNEKTNRISKRVCSFVLEDYSDIHTQYFVPKFINQYKESWNFP